MELKEFFHMNDGDGKLSYSQNSSVQKEAWLMNQYILENAIQSILSDEENLVEGLNIADLGCGVGPVPLAFVTLVIEIVRKKYKELKCNNEGPVPRIQIYMNDLPSNDFNLLFRDILNLEVFKRKEGGVPLFLLMGAPGSYYERLFPSNSLHFVHASYTLHWFSQPPKALNSEQGAVPINKGNVYISETSSEVVAKAYMTQFEQDFTNFLNCRCQEVVSKGRMLLTFRGRPSLTNPLIWQPWELIIFTKALTCLVSEGLIEEEKVDTFNFPYYCASKEELESIVKKQGSFAIKNTKTMAHHVAHEIEDKWTRSKIISKFIRAFSESLILRHFGKGVLDLLYDKLAHYAFQHLNYGRSAEHYTVAISLIKKQYICKF
ncbi:hypothetical protein BVRB_1g008010 [Beta vulgaris subsp. vulgaris]|uniref:probable caffeine synthase 4 n=1 Tax=Beta vulgaris subsp. vulgaris TaxID=3555 RepID=UPI00053FDE19|nr:probable caffeine synthase 4 [Beta vulgaris subsp. vulgaris]KMT19746.1 hypothetical protein BVRB_1g008010 [Beta vulgaris subsp. vulgaris]